MSSQDIRTARIREGARQGNAIITRDRLRLGRGLDFAGEPHLDFCRERNASKRPARRSGASSGPIFRRQLDHRRPSAITLLDFGCRLTFYEPRGR